MSTDNKKLVVEMHDEGGEARVEDRTLKRALDDVHAQRDAAIVIKGIAGGRGQAVMIIANVKGANRIADGLMFYNEEKALADALRAAARGELAKPGGGS